MPQPDTATPETSEQAILAQPRGPESVQLEGQLCVPQFGILHILILTAIAAALFKYKSHLALFRSPAIASQHVVGPCSGRFQRSYSLSSLWDRAC